MSCKCAILAGAALAALSGCSTPSGETGGGDPFLGEAVKYNAALQTINPDPVYGPDGAKPGDNGDKGAQAVKRYRTDKVKQVQTIETTTGTTGSSSGSSTPR